MLTSSCAFLNLPEELLIQIMQSCRVEDVVCLGVTCKYLQLICHARPIWASLLQDLDVTQAPDIGNHSPIGELSAIELQDKTVTAVRNSRLWRTPGYLRLRQAQSLRITPPESNEIEDGEGRDRVDPRLLSDGKHVLIEIQGRLELWSLATRAQIWNAVPSRSGDCIAFDFEIVDSGSSVMIAALFLNVATGCFVQVYKVDLQTWDDQLVIEHDLPMVFLFRLMIRGDLVMIHMPHSVQVTLLNWKAGSVLMLNFTNSNGRRTNARAALISYEHLIVAMHLGALTLIVIPIASLSEHWSDGSLYPEGMDITFTHSTSSTPDPNTHQGFDFDSPVCPNHALRLRLADPPRSEKEYPYVLALHAFTPVWQQDAADVLTEIYVVGYDDLQNKKEKGLLSYRIRLTRIDSKVQPSDDNTLKEATNGEWHLRLIEQCRAPATNLPWNSQSISNAGTMFSLHDKLNCFTLFSSTPQPTNCLPISPGIAQEGIDAEPTVVNVEPTSGALVVGTPGLIRVLRIN